MSSSSISDINEASTVSNQGNLKWLEVHRPDLQLQAVVQVLQGASNKKKNVTHKICRIMTQKCVCIDYLFHLNSQWSRVLVYFSYIFCLDICWTPAIPPYSSLLWSSGVISWHIWPHMTLHCGGSCHEFILEILRHLPQISERSSYSSYKS